MGETFGGAVLSVTTRGEVGIREDRLLDLEGKRVSYFYG